MLHHRSKRPAFLLLALTTLAPSAAPLAFALALAPTPALAQPDPTDAYKLHMANGIKLYQDANYAAAIVEFQAAYDAKPKANPLLNIALCYKAKFNYPKAIRTLETALEKHGDTMDASDKEASQNAIREMRGLLAYVSVQLTPRKATLLLDDEELPAGAADQPIPVGPGPHKFTGRTQGFAQAEKTITVVSGDKPELKLALVAEKGWVNIVAPDPKMNIAIDQVAMTTGQWSGMLAPGTHLVQMYGPGFTPFNAQVRVIAGKQINLRPGVNGVPLATPPPPPPKPVSPPPPPRRGFYALALGSILFEATHPPSFPSPVVDFGAAFGLRAGYQVNTIAGFNLSYEHSSILTSSHKDTSQTEYRVISDRLAVGLRLLTTGKNVRFLAEFGGGPAFDKFLFTLKTGAISNCAGPNGAPCPLIKLDPKNPAASTDLTVSGVDAFAYLEGGMEIDIDHVLIDLVLETQFESTGNIGPSGNVYDGQPLVNIGPALRVGYRFW